MSRVRAHNAPQPTSGFVRLAGVVEPQIVTGGLDVTGADGGYQGIVGRGGAGGGTGGQFNGAEDGGTGAWGIGGDGAAGGIFQGGTNGGKGVVGEASGDGTAGDLVATDGYALKLTSDTTSPKRAALRIVPQNAQPTGPNLVGDAYVTSAGILTICIVAGTPGEWLSVGSLITSMTTAERDAMTAANGMIIYNTTVPQFQGRVGGAWVAL